MAAGNHKGRWKVVLAAVALGVGPAIRIRAVTVGGDVVELSCEPRATVAGIVCWLLGL